MTADRAPALVALALTSSILLASMSASAAPPAQAPQAPQAPQAAPPPAAQPPMPVMPPPPVALPGVPGQVPGQPPAETPSLVSQLPIATYILTPVFAAGGALIFKLLGGQAIEDLKDPAKHTTPDQTHSLVVKARAGQIVGGVLFGVTGITTTVGTIKTIRAVMKMSKLIKVPDVDVGAAPVTGGLVVGAQGRF
jgi:hypothetical protein